MNTQKRMSPFTALFLGIFGVGAVGIAAGSAVTLYAMNIVNAKAGSLLALVDGTVEGLPGLIASLPPSIGELLDDRRMPEYASNLSVRAKFISDERYGTLRPALTVTNEGDEVVTMLTVRVAALNADDVPIREWTEVVATPIGIEDDWRGPLLPRGVRHVVMGHGWRGAGLGKTANVTAAVEIADVRVWQRNQVIAGVTSVDD